MEREQQCRDQCMGIFTASQQLTLTLTVSVTVTVVSAVALIQPK